MKANLFRLLFISFLFAVLLPSANARTYLIEMITFTNTGASNERWDFNSDQANKRKTKVNTLFAQSRDKEASNNLSYLGGIYSGLVGSSGHRILNVNRWVQRSASYARSSLVRINNSDLSIKGAVRVYAPNLLFAELNLMYSPNGDSLAVTTEGAKEAYFIDERRRMKLKEVHYFDHSKFGVVLIVVPI